MTMASAGVDKEDGSDSIPPPVSEENALVSTTPMTTTTTTTSAGTSGASTAGLEGLKLAEESYDELSEIGNGAYGTVFRGRDRNNAGRDVALKKIRVTLDDDGFPGYAVREISTLKLLGKFNHPNIVSLYDICLGKVDPRNRVNLVFVFEFVDQDLDTYLQKCPSPGLSPDTIKRLMHQVLSGVDFLHTQRIIHRDLKPQNILVSRNSQVKIADFGLSRIYDFQMRLTTKVVTLYYRAPEVLLSSSYATPVDLWSCGCIFAELFKRRPLFKGTTEGDQLQQIFDVIGRPREEDWPPDVSISLSNFRELTVGRNLYDIIPEVTPDAVDMLKKLLKFVPSKRLSAQEALQHHYFRGIPQPRVTNTTSRPTPTQSVLSPLSPSNFNPTSPPEIHQHPPISSAAITTSSVSSTTSTNTKQLITNDENNPNAGNSANTTATSIASDIPPTKTAERDTLTSPVDTTENTSINDSTMSVSSNDTIEY